MFKILTVCANGMGSSMILRMVLEPIIESLQLNDCVQVECTSAGQACGMINGADLILCAEQLHGMFIVPKGKVLITVRNLIDKKEVREKVTAAITENFSHLLPK